MKDLLIIFGILVLCFELYRLLRGYWIRRILKKKKEAKQLRKPHVMKPKSERDCPFCVKEKGKLGSPKPEIPTAWSLRKGRGGPIKKISTQGYFVQIKNANIFASLMKTSLHWSDTLFQNNEDFTLLRAVGYPECVDVLFSPYTFVYGHVRKQPPEAGT